LFLDTNLRTRGALLLGIMSSCRLLDLVLSRPPSDWDWVALSANPRISWEEMLAHPDLPWTQGSLSAKAPVDYLLAHPELQVDWALLSANPTLLERHLLLPLPWDWASASKGPNISWAFVAAHPEFPWTMDGLSQNPNVTMEVVLQNPDREWNDPPFTEGRTQFAHRANWNWVYLTPRLCQDVANVHQNPTLPWHWQTVSRDTPVNNAALVDLLEYWDIPFLTLNKHLTLDTIESLPDIPWCTERLSQRSDMTLEFVLNHPERVWDIDSLSYSIQASVSLLRSITWYPWNWGKFSFNPHLQLDEVMAHQDLPWSSTLLSMRMSLTVDQVLNTMGPIRWDFNELSANPSIPLEDIRRTAYLPWNYQRLSGL